jgi:hypothetical protein
MILWCSQSGNYPKNNLIKFGYIIYMKVKRKFQNPSIFLATHLLEVIIRLWQFGIFYIWNLANLGHLWEILCVSRNHIFQVKIWRKFVTKWNTAPCPLQLGITLSHAKIWWWRCQWKGAFNLCGTWGKP